MSGLLHAKRKFFIQAKDGKLVGVAVRQVRQGGNDLDTTPGRATRVLQNSLEGKVGKITSGYNEMRHVYKPSFTLLKMLF